MNEEEQFQVLKKKKLADSFVAAKVIVRQKTTPL